MRALSRTFASYLITNPNTASNAGSELCSAGAADPRRLGDLLRDAVGLIRVAEQEDEFHLFQRAPARGHQPVKASRLANRSGSSVGDASVTAIPDPMPRSYQGPLLPLRGSCS
jgi:hypothetical protein